MKETYYDELLNIKTVGEQKEFNKSLHYHRYEPTPYSALEQLFKKYQLKSSDRIVDFGCGKGRLNFFIHYLFQASVVGVEMNRTFYIEAIENRYRYMKKTNKNKDNIEFHCCLAENYEIDLRDNRFYFFNPFSVQIFMKIINNILLSFEKEPREIELVLFYGSKDYIFFLENQTAFEMKEEVMLPDLSEHNPYEKFVIYQLL
ncbi:MULTISPECIES: methyltransferase [Peribacillus]|uniref:methyltransferase n=1 Tax=Peribacillus TaxID=2675229 RepID=UPI00191455B9|nr:MULTISPECIES: methyltransferase [unclassified Peribacillus]MBK5446005.1 methyltransferase [Peribacillus sp. TH24]MBK5459283.1 methyltransferase [Peribacillus sp. TH27]MBK5481088.1 methyltransferase [Peribacillus sp. TH16]MBK5497469.1 methyltransferase [Peribacillus sp. TH14]WMX57391.1 methyltransferase [Peribacillus sp. R9-11]